MVNPAYPLFGSQAEAGLTGAMRGFLNSYEFRQKLKATEFQQRMQEEELKLKKQAAARTTTGSPEVPDMEKTDLQKMWNDNVVKQMDASAQQYVLETTGVDLGTINSMPIQDRINLQKSPVWKNAIDNLSKYKKKNVWNYIAAYDRSMLERKDSEGGSIDIFSRQPELLKAVEEQYGKAPESYWRNRDKITNNVAWKTFRGPGESPIENDKYPGMPKTFDGIYPNAERLISSAKTQEEADKKLIELVGKRKQAIYDLYGLTEDKAIEQLKALPAYQKLPPKVTLDNRLSSLADRFRWNTGKPEEAAYDITNDVSAAFGGKAPSKDQFLAFIVTPAGKDLFRRKGSQSTEETMSMVAMYMGSMYGDELTDAEVKTLKQYGGKSAPMASETERAAIKKATPETTPKTKKKPTTQAPEQQEGTAPGTVMWRDPANLPPEKMKYPAWTEISIEEAQARREELKKMGYLNE